MPKFQLAFTCVDCSMADVDSLHAMMDAAIDITFKTFAKHCDWRALAQQLGYAVGPAKGLLHIKDDYTVHFKRSKWKGKRCYYIDWSRIEHVFLEQNNHE